MSPLRLSGILFSLIVLVFSLFRFRRHKFSKADVLWGVLISVGLIVVSLDPSVVDSVANLLAGNYAHVGRLVSVIIISNFILYFLIFRLTSRINTTNRNIGTLVERLAFSEFEKEYGSRELRQKIVVVVPAYNEADTIAGVLEKIPKEVLGHEVTVIVSDDGSTDTTLRIAEAMGCPVISSKVNQGQGGALRLGYRVARAEGAEIVVTIDADGQHDPGEIEKLVKPILDGEADFVNGSRRLGRQFGGGSMRKIGNFVLNIFVMILLRRRITDCTSGFRAVRTDVISRFDLREQQFQSAEPLVEAIKHGAGLKEVPITVFPRKAGKTKKPRDVVYGWNWIKAVLKAWWRL